MLKSFFKNKVNIILLQARTAKRRGDVQVKQQNNKQKKCIQTKQQNEAAKIKINTKNYVRGNDYLENCIYTFATLNIL